MNCWPLCSLFAVGFCTHKNSENLLAVSALPMLRPKQKLKTEQNNNRNNKINRNQSEIFNLWIQIWHCVVLVFLIFHLVLLNYFFFFAFFFVFDVFVVQHLIEMSFARYDRSVSCMSMCVNDDNTTTNDDDDTQKKWNWSNEHRNAQ